MKVSTKLKSIAPDVWLMPFPLRMLGMDFQRHVTLIRLSSGKIFIHSTAPFTPADIASIHRLGKPEWIADVLLRHDTFAERGRAAFPSAVYLAPDGFTGATGIPAQPLVPPPAEWAGEIDVIPVLGAPAFSETVVFHRASGTLVVGDLVINFDGGTGIFSKVLLNLGAVGGHYHPGMTRPFKNAIEDPAAFAASLAEILALDIKRVIVGHGDPIHESARQKLRQAFASAGVLGPADAGAR